MGYDVQVKLKVREGDRWRRATSAEKRAMRKIAEASGYYVLREEASKWYSLSTDLLVWAEQINAAEVRADVKGEDGTEWREYVRGSAFVRVSPKIRWPKDPWKSAG